MYILLCGLPLNFINLKNNAKEKEEKKEKCIGKEMHKCCFFLKVRHIAVVAATLVLVLKRKKNTKIQNCLNCLLLTNFSVY